MRHDSEHEMQARQRVATLIGQFSRLDVERQNLVLDLVAEMASGTSKDDPVVTHDVAATLQ
jgi:hypothetical protein